MKRSEEGGELQKKDPAYVTYSEKTEKNICYLYTYL